MIVGVPKEIKDSESRVGVTPAGVKALTEAGHTVLVETQAGAQSGFPDAEYQNAGAEIVGDAGYAWGKAEMVVKVKEPIESEYVYFREGLVLFTYLHLAPLPALTDKLLEAKVAGIAYETVRNRQGTLPLLMPMSEVAGRMSVQVGASCLERERGGRGILLGGVPGVPPAHVAILGGGVVGTNAHSDQVSPDTASLLTLLDLRRHEADVVHVGGLSDIDYVGDIGKVHIVVAPDKHDALGAIGINIRQLAQQIAVVHVGVVDFVRRGLARAINNLNNDGTVVLRWLLLRVLRRLRHQSIQTLGGYRNDNHENDQQDQKNIDHGRDVDLAHRSAAAASGKCHGSNSLFPEFR